MQGGGLPSGSKRVKWATEVPWKFQRGLSGSRRLLAIKGLTQLEVLVTGHVTGSSHAGGSLVSRASQSNHSSRQGVEP